MIRKIVKEDKGALIVEATMVFPVMFLVIFLMLFAGNAYLQKCRVESLVTDYAIEAAAKCADPMLKYAEQGAEKIPSMSDMNVIPYRYILSGDIKDMVGDLEQQLETDISNMSTGLFSGMKPNAHVDDVKMEFNNHFIYSTLSVEVQYDVELPVRLMGSDWIIMTISTRIDVPVSDSPEFIKNIDLVEDYLQRLGITEKIDKVKEDISKKIKSITDKVEAWKNK